MTYNNFFKQNYHAAAAPNSESSYRVNLACEKQGADGAFDDDSLRTSASSNNIGSSFYANNMPGIASSSSAANYSLNRGTIGGMTGCRSDIFNHSNTENSALECFPESYHSLNSLNNNSKAESNFYEAPHLIMEQVMEDEESDNDEGSKSKKSGRRKIKIEYIPDRNRRHITFSKRKAGIMKKAYELSTLTGTQVLLLVASETGHVYTFATSKFQDMVSQQEGRTMIQRCLGNPEDLAQASPQSSVPSRRGSAFSSAGQSLVKSRESMEAQFEHDIRDLRRNSAPSNFTYGTGINNSHKSNFVVDASLKSPLQTENLDFEASLAHSGIDPNFNKEFLCDSNFRIYNENRDALSSSGHKAPHLQTDMPNNQMLHEISTNSYQAETNATSNSEFWASAALQSNPFANMNVTEDSRRETENFQNTIFSAPDNSSHHQDKQIRIVHAIQHNNRPNENSTENLLTEDNLRVLTANACDNVIPSVKSEHFVPGKY